MTTQQFHTLAGGKRIPGDWFDGAIPENIEVGDNSVIDSSHSFLFYRSSGSTGLRVGNNVTIWRTALSVGQHGCIEIGDFSYLANAYLACDQRITIGSHVLLANGVTIVDSDFHPADLEDRIADTIAVSPIGSLDDRPPFDSQPVVIEDNVRVGHNATILKGVRIGRDAIVAAGAVVTRDVPEGSFVAGNPARESSQGEAS